MNLGRLRYQVEPEVELSVIEAGPEDGELLIFLHGFPEAAFAWEPYVEHFAELGYRVMAPDQRGYDQSDKPPRISDYRIDRLALDVVALMDAAGRDKAYVTGHDWGAAVGWWLAIRHPERVQRLAVMNLPHPAALRRFLMSDPGQIAKSWYVFFFQIPWLPELQFTKRAEITWKRLERTGRSDTFTALDRERLIKAWRRPGAAKAMINWYRAALRQAVERLPADLSVSTPTLILWGEQDTALRKELVEASLEFCEQGQTRLFPSATHWVLHEERPELFKALQAHFQA